MVNTFYVGSSAPFLSFHKMDIPVEPVEPDCYVRSLERYGIICYKQLGDPARYFAFAWQIVEHLKLLMRFDYRDARFIESVARRERHDSWYRRAGYQLRDLGFEQFMDCLVTF